MEKKDAIKTRSIFFKNDGWEVILFFSIIFFFVFLLIDAVVINETNMHRMHVDMLIQ